MSIFSSGREVGPRVAVLSVRPALFEDERGGGRGSSSSTVPTPELLTSLDRADWVSSPNSPGGRVNSWRKLEAVERGGGEERLSQWSMLEELEGTSSGKKGTEDSRDRGTRCVAVCWKDCSCTICGPSELTSTEEMRGEVEADGDPV